MDYGVGSGPSIATSFTVSAVDLNPASGNVVLTASSQFSISLLPTGPFVSSVTIPYTGSALATTTVYVRLNAGYAYGTYSGAVTPSILGFSYPAQVENLVGNVLLAGCSELIISEYVEGTGSNQYVEVYNPSSASINLSNYSLMLYRDGATAPSVTDALSGTLAPGGVKVYKNAAATIYAGTATASPAVTFDGNDAIKLRNNTTGIDLDIIGHIGESTAWTSSGYTTMNKTLIRKSSVSRGIEFNPVPAGFPTLVSEWDTLPVDNVINTGIHTSGCRSTAVPYDNRCNAVNLRTVSKFSDWTFTPYNDALNPNIDTVLGTTFGGSRAAGEPLGSCPTGPTSTYSTSWYRLITPSCAANRVRVSTNTTQTGFNTRLAVWRAANPLDCSSALTELACNDDAGTTPLPSASDVVMSPPTYNPGEIVFVQVSGYGGDQGNYGLIVDVDAPDIRLHTPTVTTMRVALANPATLVGSGYLGAAVRYRITGATGWATINATPTDTAVTLTGLNPSTSYDVWVMYNCQSDYWFSAKQTMRTADNCPLGTFSSAPNVTALAGHCRQMVVTWPAVTGATNYKVYWQAVGSTSILSDNVPVGALTYTSPAGYMYVGTAYNVWVQARCSTPAPARTLNSATVLFTTCSGSPRLAEPEGDLNVQIGNVSFYQMTAPELSIYLQNDAEGLQVIDLKTISAESFNKPSVNSIVDGQLTVFPNPANDQATVEFDLPQTTDMVELKMMNIEGQIVWTKTVRGEMFHGTETLNLREVPAGIYLVKLSSANYNKSVKLVVEH